MNLKAILLEPACEGRPPAQGDDGTILLHGRDATVRGTAAPLGARREETDARLLDKTLGCGRVELYGPKARQIRGRGASGLRPWPGRQ